MHESFQIHTPLARLLLMPRLTTFLTGRGECILASSATFAARDSGAAAGARRLNAQRTVSEEASPYRDADGRHTTRDKSRYSFAEYRIRCLPIIDAEKSIVAVAK